VKSPRRKMPLQRTDWQHHGPEQLFWTNFSQCSICYRMTKIGPQIGV
jgi:hypothetical protein